MNPPAKIQRVVVVGGGLAGMAAAVALESAGLSVTLIEARKTLGGRAGSHDDPVTGETFDNCQHVLLGCCTQLVDFYRRIGAEGKIHWDSTIRFVDPRGRMHSLWGTPGLPAPLHLAPAMLGFSALTIAERFALARAMIAMLRLGRAGRRHLAETSFGAWLDEHRQPAGLIAKLYEPVLVSALNERCRDVSAEYAIQVFQESLLFDSRAYRIGTPACPLTELYAKIPCRDVRLGTRLTALRFDAGRVTGIEIGPEFLPTDAVVLAVNYPVLEKWIPPDLAAKDSRFAGLPQLRSVPILGAHLWFDRPVLTAPHAAFLQGPLQWLFRKSPDGRTVHGVISAAGDFVDRPREELIEDFAAQIRQTFPAARDAKLLRGTIVIEKRATFSPTPGIDRLRPSQSPPPDGIPNVYLAGDFTQTGWPATMEGAVRGGYLAAQAITGIKLK